MPRIQPLQTDQATAEAAQQLEAVQKKFGRVPNILATMAHAPAALEGYLGFSKALTRGTLSGKRREQIALTVADVNGCAYCTAAHALAGKMNGLNETELADARRGRSADPKTDAALRFAASVARDAGRVSDTLLQEVRDHGFSDGQITEIVAVVALNIFTNLFNHVAETEVDFPAPAELEPAV